MRFDRIISLIILCLALAGCSKGVERSDSANPENTASYVVGKVSGSNQHVNSSDFGLPNEALFSFRACLREVSVEEPIAGGENFTVEDNKSQVITHVTTDPQGCVHWNEKVKFQYLNDETYYLHERQIVAKSNQLGTHRLKIAVNPWSVDGQAVADIRPGYTAVSKLAREADPNILTTNENHFEVENVSIELQNEALGRNAEGDLMVQFKPMAFRRTLDGTIKSIPLSKGGFNVRVSLNDTQKSLFANNKTEAHAQASRARNNKNLLELRQQFVYERPISTMNMHLIFEPADKDAGLQELACLVPLGRLDRNVIRANGCQSETRASLAQKQSIAGSKVQSQKTAPFLFTQIRAVNKDVPPEFFSKLSQKPRAVRLELETCLVTGINKKIPVADKQVTIYPNSTFFFEDAKKAPKKISATTKENGCVRWHEIVPMRYYAEEHYKEGVVRLEVDGIAFTRLVYFNPWQESLAKTLIDRDYIQGARKNRNLPSKLVYLDREKLKKIDDLKLDPAELSTRRDLDGPESEKQAPFQPKKAKIVMTGFGFDFLGRKMRFDAGLTLNAERYYRFEFKPFITRYTDRGPEQERIGMGKYKVKILLEASHGDPKKEAKNLKDYQTMAHKELYNRKNPCTSKTHILENRVRRTKMDEEIYWRCMKNRYLDYNEVVTEANGTGMIVDVKLNFHDIRYIHSRNIISFEFIPLDKESGLEPITYRGRFEPVYGIGGGRLKPRLEIKSMTEGYDLDYDKMQGQEVAKKICTTPKGFKPDQAPCSAELVSKVESITSIVKRLKLDKFFEKRASKTGEENLAEFRKDISIEDFEAENKKLGPGAIRQDEIDAMVDTVFAVAAKEKVRPFSIKKLPLSTKSLLGRLCTLFYARLNSDNFGTPFTNQQRYMMRLNEQFQRMERQCRIDPNNHLYLTTSEHVMSVDPYPLSEEYGDSNNIPIGAHFTLAEGDVIDKIQGETRRGGFDGALAAQGTAAASVGIKVLGNGGTATGSLIGTARGFGGYEWYATEYKLQNQTDKQSIDGGFFKTINVEQITFELNVKTKQCVIVQPKQRLFNQLLEKNVRAPGGYQICRSTLKDKLIKETFHYLYLFFRSHRSNFQDLPGSFAMRPWSLVIRGKKNFNMFMAQLQDKSRVFFLHRLDRSKFPNSVMRRMFRRFNSAPAGVIDIDLLNDSAKKNSKTSREQLKDHIPDMKTRTCMGLKRYGQENMPRWAAELAKKLNCDELDKPAASARGRQEP